MAADEALLESAINDGLATVRVYAWSEPTVSLGYFQRADEIAADPQLAGLAAVRRLSGGGAILHHHEITYSLAIPATHPLLCSDRTGNPKRKRGMEYATLQRTLADAPGDDELGGIGADAGASLGEGQTGVPLTSLTSDPSPAMDRRPMWDASRAQEGSEVGAPLPNPSRLYRLAHKVIIHVVAECAGGAPSDHPPGGARRRLNGAAPALRMRGDSALFDRPFSVLHPHPTSLDSRPPSANPFLCFGRGDPNDIVLGPHKIVGSAQRRRRGAVLQHGSLLLRRSPHAAEHPGLYDLTGLDLQPERLAEQVGRRLAESLAESWMQGELTDSERKLAEALSREKYARLTWTPREPESRAAP